MVQKKIAKGVEGRKGVAGGKGAGAAKKGAEDKRSYVAPVLCAIVVILALMAVMAAVVATYNLKNASDDAETASTETDYGALEPLEGRELLDFLANKETGLVYLGRPTCPHCRVFAPILISVVKADNLKVYYYDTDAAKSDPDLKSETMDAVKVTAVPTFMYIRDGVEVERLENTESEAALREFIEKYVQADA